MRLHQPRVLERAGFYRVIQINLKQGENLKTNILKECLWRKFATEAVENALDEEGKYSKVIKHRVDQVETKYADLRKEFDLIKGRNVEVSSDEVKKDLEKDLLEKATNHIQSRMDRKNNIIVHGAPEEVKGELALWMKSEKK